MVPFPLDPGKKKNLGTSLTNYVQDLCGENWKTDEQNQLNKWRNIPCSWIRRLNIVNMSVLPNLVGRFDSISI